MDGGGNGGNGGQTQLSPEFQKVLASLTPEQRRNYNTCATNQEKVRMLRVILADRKKSETFWEMTSIFVYAIVTISICVGSAVYFSSEESTKNFGITLNCVYYSIKFILLMVKLERTGIIYNKLHDLIIIIPPLLGISLAVVLGLYVQQLTLTINFINLGLEISKFIASRVEIGGVSIVDGVSSINDTGEFLTVLDDDICGLD
ncbi:6161_t:CDS:2, partial [Funneliformis mosseae]